MQQRRDIPHIHKFLLPCAYLYNIGVWARNLLFDCNILPSQRYDIPVISVGNLTVGGTGKTPMIEHLIELLSPHKRVAVLSRGYRRHTKGYILAHEHSTVQEIGDEPYQMHRKYPDIMIAVDGNRRRGIERLLQHATPPEVILLDDAHQHRYVKPSLAIVLSDYNRPIYADLLMPAGRLREPISGLKRADIVVLTKAPHTISDKELESEAQQLRISSDIIYSTHIQYDTPRNMVDNEPLPLSDINHDTRIILLTGIANPTPIVEHLSQYTRHITLHTYADHHDFTDKELRSTAQAAEQDGAIIITTEKDAARLSDTAQLPSIFKQRCYTLPMKAIPAPRHNKKSFDTILLQAAGIATTHH